MSAKKPTRAEMQEVLDRMIQGAAWYEACSLTFGIQNPSPQLTALVFKLRIDKTMRKMIQASQDQLSANENVLSLGATLREMSEVFEMARATGDGSLLLNAIKTKAEMTGILIKRPTESDPLVGWSGMTAQEKERALVSGIERLKVLQDKLQERGIGVPPTIDHSTT